MDQRIGTVENQVSEIYSVHKDKKRDYYKSLPRTYSLNDNMVNNNNNNNNMNNMNYNKNSSYSNSIRSIRQQEVFKPNDFIDVNNNSLNLNNYGDQNYYMNNENKQVYNHQYDNNIINNLNQSASKVRFK